MSTREVDDLVTTLGADTGIGETRCVADLDAEVAAFGTAPWPRRPTRTVPRRDLVQGPGEPAGRVPGRRGQCRRAQGGAGHGRRGRRGRGVVDIVPAHAEGPRPGRVQLVVSDVYPGLKAAIGAVLLGSSWQRRR